MYEVLIMFDTGYAFSVKVVAGVLTALEHSYDVALRFREDARPLFMVAVNGVRVSVDLSRVLYIQATEVK